MKPAEIAFGTILAGCAAKDTPIENPYMEETMPRQIERRLEAIGMTNLAHIGHLSNPGNEILIYANAGNSAIKCTATINPAEELSLADTDVTCWNNLYGQNTHFTRDLPFTSIAGEEDCQIGPRPITTVSREDGNRLANCADDLTITIKSEEIPDGTALGTLCLAYENTIMGLIPGKVVFDNQTTETVFKEILCKPTNSRPPRRHP